MNRYLRIRFYCDQSGYSTLALAREPRWQNYHESRGFKRVITLRVPRGYWQAGGTLKRLQGEMIERTVLQ